MGSVRWVEHRGVSILVTSYSGCATEQETLDLLAEQVRTITAAGTKVRVIHDYRDAILGERFLEESLRLSRERRARAIERAGVVGLTGIRKALFVTYRILSGDETSRTFSDYDAALDWVSGAPG